MFFHSSLKKINRTYLKDFFKKYLYVYERQSYLCDKIREVYEKRMRGV